jgi:hypothetical protein
LLDDDGVVDVDGGGLVDVDGAVGADHKLGRGG